MRFLSSDRACARASDREAARRPAGMPANHWSAHSALDIVGALTGVRAGAAGPDRNPYAPRAPPASGSSPSDPAQDENRSRPKRKWRSGRSVPPRTPPHRGQNRAIMRTSSSASEMPARTILPERHNAEAHEEHRAGRPRRRTLRRAWSRRRRRPTRSPTASSWR